MLCAERTNRHQGKAGQCELVVEWGREVKLDLVLRIAQLKR